MRTTRSGSSSGATAQVRSQLDQEDAGPILAVTVVSGPSVPVERGVLGQRSFLRPERLQPRLERLQRLLIGRLGLEKLVQGQEDPDRQPDRENHLQQEKQLLTIPAAA